MSTLTRRASKQAYEKAGIGPKDIALTELHDCFATAELVHYENLGLCGDGEAGKFIDAGGGDASGPRRPRPGQRLGRPAQQGPSAGRDRRREHLRGRVASDAGRSREGSPGAERQGRPGPRHRAGLGLHDSRPDDLIDALIVDSLIFDSSEMAAAQAAATFR